MELRACREIRPSSEAFLDCAPTSSLCGGVAYIEPRRLLCEICEGRDNAAITAVLTIVDHASTGRTPRWEGYGPIVLSGASQTASVIYRCARLLL
jgi:hypothetical protein